MIKLLSVNPLTRHNSIHEISKALGRSVLQRRPLPPGPFVHLDRLERCDRRILITQAKRYGPVFKGLIEDRVGICVVNHPLARRVLKEHAGQLKPVTIDLRSLFAAGFMREMKGDVHQHYRKGLVRTLQSCNFQNWVSELETIVLENLRPCALGSERISAHAWSELLSTIATGMLIHIFFGAPYGTPFHQQLLERYRELGPNGVVWYIGTKQAGAFHRLRSLLQPSAAGKHSLLSAVADHGLCDETMLGNLIYMVELGRYDLRGLFRWLSKYGADHPELLEKIAADTAGASTGPPSITEAFVLEVLRLEQSERLLRNVLEDIILDGMLIPKGALLRVCMWEEHKNEMVFDNPFSFEPSRFQTESKFQDRFSPFGLDHHHCPFSAISVNMAMVFLRQLARNFTINAKGGNPPIRGPYHWEPGLDFSVGLTPRPISAAETPQA